MEKYDCLCFKCHQKYQSTDKNDLDNEGYCPSCKEVKNKLAEQIDARVKSRTKKEKPAMKVLDDLNFRGSPIFIYKP